MQIINTATRKPEDFDEWTREQIYNGLDCAVTLEVFNSIAPHLDNHTVGTYNFSRDLQGPVLEMRLRGILIDQVRKEEVIEEYSQILDQLDTQLHKIVFEGVGMVGFNWQSDDDVKTLLYSHLGLPIQHRRGRPTSDRAAREKLEEYLIARPIVSHLNAMADIGKKISVLRTKVDSDGRIRTSYNIAGTNTGRFSSSLSEFGTGGNLQNIEESLRSIFIADPGWKFAKFDAKSGESFVVGAIEWNLFGDGRYLAACESGDPHTAAARICWPELGWTGDLKRDKLTAETPFYRHYTYRFTCKKLGHGSNYGGQAATLAEQSRIPVKIVQSFQPKYFKAFPAHLAWQEWVGTQLRTGTLISLMGRKRQFWGRRSDPATLREAIAYDPQSSLADIVNDAMLRLWRDRVALVMLQDHDAITFMYPEKEEGRVVPTLWQALPKKVPLARGRELCIPYDCKVGWNRGDFSEKNPNGLKDWAGEDKRKRGRK